MLNKVMDRSGALAAPATPECDPTQALDSLRRECRTHWEDAVAELGNCVASTVQRTLADLVKRIELLEGASRLNPITQSDPDIISYFGILRESLPSRAP